MVFASPGVLGASAGFFWSTRRVLAWAVEGALGGSEGFLDSAAGMGWVVVGALGGTVVSLSLAVGAAFTGSVAFVVADGAVVPGALAGSVGFLASAVAGAFASLGVLGASTGFFWSTGRVSAWVVEGALGGAVVSFALVVGATFTGTSAFAVAVVGAVLLGALAGSVGFLTSAETEGAFVFDSLLSGMKFLLLLSNCGNASLLGTHKIRREAA